MSIKKSLRTIFFAALLMLAGLSAAWAKDKILYSAQAGDFWQIFTTDSDGQSKTQLTTSAGDKRQPVYIADAGKILYRTGNNELFIVDQDGKNERRFLADIENVSDADYSPKLKQIVFVRFQEQTKDNSHLWLCDLNGANQKIITNTWGLQYNPSFSRDGQRIVYAAGHGYPTHEVFVLDLKSKKETQLTDNKALDFAPAFSPNGKEIAYVSDEAGNYEICIMDSQGKNKRQLTHNQAINTQPRWSFDGKEIIYSSAASGNLAIWKMDRDGKNPRQLTFDAPARDPYLMKESD